MAGDAPGKIVIVGGGVAGLAAAFELTKPGRCPGELVTVYQAGWRLGGKCATGRDASRRIVEHGLHIWFGYYENAFQLLREVYDELPQTPRRFQTWRDAFRPAPATQVGDARLNASGGFIPFVWPDRAGSPGDGRRPSLPQAVFGVLDVLAQFHDALAEAVAPTTEVSPARAHARAFDRLFGVRDGLAGLTPRQAVRSAARWWAGLGGDMSDPLHLTGVTDLVREAADATRRHVAEQANPGVRDVLLAETTDIAAAFLGGLVDDAIIGGAPLDELDESDLRDWLIDNGADAGGVERSPFLRALYDTMFQYEDGESERPSYGAGTAAQVVLRMLGTYKGAAVWKPNAGLGEAFISPLYETLRARGVRFEFFRKLERIELSEDRRDVARLRFARQAEPPDGFEPTFEFAGLTCWPDAPPAAFSQGKGPQDDFESRWGTRRVAPDLVLERGEHFDEVVLAIPPGAFKPLGDDAGPCEALIATNPRFRAMVREVGLVPSLSAQLWLRATSSELGWPGGAAALVGGPRPLSIWADMTHLLDVEDSGDAPPKSLNYFCSTFGARADAGPSGAAPAQADAREQTAAWLEREAATFWPGARAPGPGGVANFRWDVIADSNDGQGAERLERQVVKANVDPWACCSGSAAGSTAWRLGAEQSGFRNLTLAGSWTATGLNTECIEAAVMSGKQAARALCGEPRTIAGESFLRGRAGGERP